MLLSTSPQYHNTVFLLRYTSQFILNHDVFIFRKYLVWILAPAQPILSKDWLHIIFFQLSHKCHSNSLQHVTSVSLHFRAVRHTSSVSFDLALNNIHLQYNIFKNWTIQSLHAFLTACQHARPYNMLWLTYDQTCNINPLSPTFFKHWSNQIPFASISGFTVIHFILSACGKFHL